MKIQKKICRNCGQVYMIDENFLENQHNLKTCKQGHLWFNCTCNSSLMIANRGYLLSTKDSTLSEAAQSVLQKIISKKALPHMSKSVQDVRNMLEQENIEVQEVIKNIRTYPLISKEIINIANKMKRAESDEEIKNVHHAVIYLGIYKLKDMVASIGAQEVHVNTNHFSSEEFWREAFDQALILEFLAKRFTPYHESNKLYLIGFMINIGKIINAYFYPENTEKISLAYKSPKNQYSWSDLEKIYQSESSMHMAEVVSNLWDMPETVSEVCQNHCLSESMSEYISTHDLAIFSNQISNWIHHKLTDIDQNILDRMSTRLKISEKELDELASQASHYVRSANNSQTLS